MFLRPCNELALDISLSEKKYPFLSLLPYFLIFWWTQGGGDE